MTPEEKQALQMLVIDEMTRHQQDQPLMLIDALLADQGRMLLHAVLSRRLTEAQQGAQLAGHLMRAFQQTGRDVEEHAA